MNEAVEDNVAEAGNAAAIIRSLHLAKQPPVQVFPIFLYEDDRGLANQIVLAFEAEGLLVTILETEAEVVDAALRTMSSVFIMDRMVHGVDSLTIIQKLRDLNSRVPVVVISNMTSVDDRIRGLKAGGDDYLIKPFAMGELVARVEALIRRSIGESPKEFRETRLVAGDLEMDLIDRSVRRGKRVISLLPREFVLLEYFMRNQGEVITRTMMLESVWKYRAPMNTNVVDVHISNLRRKIDDAGETQLIRNKRGIGFILAPSKSDSG